MASATPVQPESFEAIELAADAKFAASFATPETPPEPAVVAPETPVAAPATPAPTQESTPPVEAASTPTPSQATPVEEGRYSFNLNDYPPETRKNIQDALKKYNGDIGKAFDSYWSATRALGKKAEEAQAAPVQAQPEVKQQVQQVPATPVHDAQAEIDNRKRVDPTVLELKRNYDSYVVEEARLLGATTQVEIDQKRYQLQDDIRFIERELKSPYVTENQELFQDKERQLTRLLQVNSRLAAIDANKTTLDLNYRDRAQRIANEVNNEAYQAQQQQETESRQAEQRDAYAGRVEEVWNTTLPQVAKDVLGKEFTEDSDLMQEFFDMAKAKFLFKLEANEVPTIPEVVQMLRETAAQKKSLLDKAHRFQSALYKTQIPTNPVIPISTVTTTTPIQSQPNETWEQIEERHDSNVRERLKLLAG